MARNEILPSQNASTAASLAALYTAGAVPAARPAVRASSTAGNVSLSSGSNVHDVGSVHEFGAVTPGSRSGQVRARPIGSRMSGGEHWAIVEPSTYSTIECTIDCGWTTTVMSSIATS